jgi:pimeloyl-ACP methyl ester carboxylesterase
LVLCVADIERWNPDAVRDVFNAARNRYEAARFAAEELGTLPAFATWGGDAADAARQAIGKTRADLDAHGAEALVVAQAADQAADGIEDVKRRLNDLDSQANSLHMQIDELSNTVRPGPDFRGDAKAAQDAVSRLQPQLDKIIAEANRVDDELAHAINMAGGKEPIPLNVGPPVGADGLTPSQVASDTNQEQLRRLRADLQARHDELQPIVDKLAAQAYMDGPGSSLLGSPYSQYFFDEYRDVTGRLADIDAIQQSLKTPESYLTQLTVPTGPSKPLLAAVAVGNPDTAQNVSVTVPGVGSTTRDSLPGMVSEANNLRNEELRQLTAAGKPASAATIAWMGYTPPPNPLNDQGLDNTTLTHVWTTMTDGTAKAAAPDLANYLEQLRAGNPDTHLTLLGHSYGSLTSSLALQDLNAQGLHPVNDVVFYGSPGLEMVSPAQLGLNHGTAYAMQAPGDPITNLVAPLAPLHGWGADPYATPGMVELSTEAGFDPGNIWRDGVGSHADYPRMFTNNAGDQLLRMSGYNMAAVAAGLPDNEVEQSLVPPMLTGGPPHQPGR